MVSLCNTKSCSYRGKGSPRIIIFISLHSYMHKIKVILKIYRYLNVVHTNMSPVHDQLGIIQLFYQSMISMRRTLCNEADYEQPDYVWEGNLDCFADFRPLSSQDKKSCVFRLRESISPCIAESFSRFLFNSD